MEKYKNHCQSDAMSPGNFATNNNLESDGKPNRVIINVGGTKHECYISTILNFPDTRLSWIAEAALNNENSGSERNEFFFDRHPGCFQNILNYFRTGKLHCPNDVCGPLFEEELIFWGLDERMMEPCCWSNYNQHRDAQKNLKMFDSLIYKTKEDSEEEIDAMMFKLKDMKPYKQLLIKTRAHLWNILEEPFSSYLAQATALLSLVIIIVSVTTFCLQTMKHFKKYNSIFSKLENVYCAIFTLEFLLRLVSCPSLKLFFKEPITYFDFLSTLQFYLSYVLKSNAVDSLVVVRLVRLLRLFRFFKNLSGMQVIGQTLKASFKELMLLALIFMIPMVVFSTLVYYAERDNLPSDFESIPEAFWWAIVSMTTVGYGDMVPRSGPGKIVGAMCACCGILIVALPVSVVGRNFALFYSYAQARIKLPKKKNPTLISADKNLVYDSTHKVVDTKLKETASLMLNLIVPRINGRRNAYTPSIEPRHCRQSFFTKSFTSSKSISKNSIFSNSNESIESIFNKPSSIKDNSFNLTIERNQIM
ncbi:potassium voltage-gated channel subfamily C member 3 isoform X1 [Hydra vulgaris]|uniref:potassium voltage-gated channel subfamily C member 3 isoform X1 n=1 Tax=Hydra vulgaris TaxID=6087 RepID=UPI001F5F8A8B|nr:potassium voltage-gated channel subfamily C member 3 isoform X1 [Hydra vulgaris]XP_047123162.1 potassium voltage-gated channel subfamily C member 3 isoform X1 [Hydra vulgaris]